MSEAQSDPPREAELDAEFDEWLEQDEGPPPRQRGVTMRHPALLVVVLVCSALVSVRASQDLRHRVLQREVLSCGDIGERPMQKAEAPDTVEPLPDDRWCSLTGIVSSPVTLATGEAVETNNPYKKHAERTFFVRLSGERVWAAIPGDDWDMNNHRIKKGSLFGFQVTGVGHIRDPDRSAELRRTAEVLRLKWGEPRETEIRIFDLTKAPPSIWPPLGVLSVATLATLLAVYGLALIIRRRREDAVVEARA